MNVLSRVGAARAWLTGRNPTDYLCATVPFVDRVCGSKGTGIFKITSGAYKGQSVPGKETVKTLPDKHISLAAKIGDRWGIGTAYTDIICRDLHRAFGPMPCVMRRLHFQV